MDPSVSDRLRHLICHRRSARGPYDPNWHVSERELDAIVTAARWAPTLHNSQNFELVIVENPQILRLLGALRVTEGYYGDTSAELVRTITELEQRQTGLLTTELGETCWKNGDHGSRPFAETIAGAPVLIVVAFDPGRQPDATTRAMLDMIGLGCVLENMWLAASSLGLDVQVLSSLGAVPHEAATVLGIPEDWTIAFTLRIGHAIAPHDAQRVRRDVHRFVHRDRFRRS
ncbi:MAG: nitroreductase family protein [Kofleriaceae bacterium]